MYGFYTGHETHFACTSKYIPVTMMRSDRDYDSDYGEKWQFDIDYVEKPRSSCGFAFRFLEVLLDIPMGVYSFYMDGVVWLFKHGAPLGSNQWSLFPYEDSYNWGLKSPISHTHTHLMK